MWASTLEGSGVCPPRHRTPGCGPVAEFQEVAFTLELALPLKCSAMRGMDHGQRSVIAGVLNLGRLVKVPVSTKAR